VQAEAVLVCALVDEIEPCLAFYRDVLGLGVTFREGDYCELGGRIALCSRAAHRAAFPGAEPTPGGSNVVVIVRVDDVDRWVAALRARGAPVLQEPRDYPWGERFAFVADPAGNPVALYARAGG